jgi:hypothetical protein
MLWLKRNLFLAVGGLITLLALGCGGYYFWSAKQDDSRIEADLQAKKTDLDNVSRSDPFPSDSNIALMQAEGVKLRQIITNMSAYFSAIPTQPETGQRFATLLNNTMDELRRKAQTAGVALPAPKYAFSFEAQKDKLRFGDRSFPVIPEQLAEIKVILQILYDSKINKLVNVSRTPVSTDDDAAKGPNAADYHELPIGTNAITGTVSHSYRFQFECFSTELAAVLENLFKSKYGLHVKALQIEPTALPKGPTYILSEPSAGPATPPPARPTTPGRAGQPPTRGGTTTPTPTTPTPPGARGAAPAGGRGAAPDSQTVLAERLLKADMVVEVIQPGR